MSLKGSSVMSTNPLNPTDTRPLCSRCAAVMILAADRDGDGPGRYVCPNEGGFVHLRTGFAGILHASIPDPNPVYALASDLRQRAHAPGMKPADMVAAFVDLRARLERVRVLEAGRLDALVAERMLAAMPSVPAERDSRGNLVRIGARGPEALYRVDLVCVGGASEAEGAYVGCGHTTRVLLASGEAPPPHCPQCGGRFRVQVSHADPIQRYIRLGEPRAFDGDPFDHVLQLTESDRQLVLMALAALSLQSPGFDFALSWIAGRIDDVQDDRPVMYDGFRASRSSRS
jgi:ribosomal protein S27AE